MPTSHAVLPLLAAALVVGTVIWKFWRAVMLATGAAAAAAATWVAAGPATDYHHLIAIAGVWILIPLLVLLVPAWIAASILGRILRGVWRLFRWALT